MQKIDQDIIDLNLSWLVKARELAKLDQTKAAVMLGFDVSTADRIAQLPLEHLHDIARLGVMLFQPRFHTGFWDELLDDNKAHAIRFQALLMASKEVSTQ